MVDRKVVVIVAVAVGVVLVGGIAGAMLLGGGDGVQMGEPRRATAVTAVGRPPHRRVRRRRQRTEQR
jgi:uncharacterized membrane protein